MKEIIRSVKKLDDTQLGNLAEVVNRVFIMRHKVRQLWFDINKQLKAQVNQENSDATSNSPEEETK